MSARKELVRILQKCHGSHQALTGFELTEMLNDKGIGIDQSSLTKIIDKIRLSDEVPGLVSDFNGYYWTRNIEKHIEISRSKRNRLFMLEEALIRQYKITHNEPD